MGKKEWLVCGILTIGSLLLYQQGRLDTHQVLRVIVGFAVYVLSQLGIRHVRVSVDLKNAFMAILLSVLLIWILDASLSAALCVFGLVGIRFLLERSKRNPGSQG